MRRRKKRKRNDDLEYQRFIIKLNEGDIRILSLFCLFNKINVNIKELKEKRREKNSYDGKLKCQKT